MENKSESTEIPTKITEEGRDGIARLSHDRTTSGAGDFRDGTGPENNELAWARRHIKEAVIVERKTELAGWGVGHRKKTTHPLAEERVNPLPIDLPAEEPENYGISSSFSMTAWTGSSPARTGRSSASAGGCRDSKSGSVPDDEV